MALEFADIEDANDALARKNGADRCPCPACGSTRWLTLKRRIGFRAGADAFETVALACKLCGYLRFHIADLLLDSN